MLFVAIAVGLFFWAVKSNQFDDLDREAVNILFDDDEPLASKKKSDNPLLAEESEKDQTKEIKQFSQLENNESDE